MNEVEKPTNDQLCEDKVNFESVAREADNTWRHGCYMWQVFRRKSDDTYWAAAYCLSTDGETNGLRDGDVEITRVYPHIKTVTDYNTTAPE